MNTDATIPADWDLADPHTWRIGATVDAYAGEHQTGAIYRRYEEIAYCATNYDNGDLDAIEDASAEEQREAAAWWADVLGRLVAGKAAAAEALPEEFEAALVVVGINPDDWHNGRVIADGIEDEARLWGLIADALAPREAGR